MASAEGHRGFNRNVGKRYTQYKLLLRYCHKVANDVGPILYLFEATRVSMMVKKRHLKKIQITKMCD